MSGRRKSNQVQRANALEENESIDKLHESYDYRLKSLIIRHGRNVNNSHYTSMLAINIIL